MNYLLLAYIAEKQLTAMTPAEQVSFERACLSNEDALRARGHLLATVQLLSPGDLAASVTTVCFDKNELMLGEVPFTATEGRLSKLFLITARDLNEVIRLAAQMPFARMGTLEVYPTRETVMPLSGTILALPAREGWRRCI